MVVQPKPAWWAANPVAMELGRAPADLRLVSALTRLAAADGDHFQRGPALARQAAAPRASNRPHSLHATCGIHARPCPSRAGSSAPRPTPSAVPQTTGA